MKYRQEVLLKNGRTAILRNGTKADGEAVLEVFDRTHGETDHLLSYPDENRFDAEKEGQFLQEKTESENEIEIVAVVDGKIVGTAGIEVIGTTYKIRHRADIGIAILRDHWGMGIGRALMEACIQCAREAGYAQIELTVVAENSSAIRLYQSLGFTEFGRNPLGFKSRTSGYQELVYMRMEL